MKTLATILITIGLAFLNLPSQADENDLETFYINLIEQKIDNCIRKASLIDSNSENLRACARESFKQASFYKHNKEILIKKMTEQDIEANRNVANYFLIKAYTDFSPLN
ncbi:MAG: hypothetical protein WCA08_19695 [Desulfoferrobacter sp.]